MRKITENSEEESGQQKKRRGINSWIDSKGELLIAHDYENYRISRFANLAEFITWETDVNNLTYDVVRKNERPVCYKDN